MAPSPVRRKEHMEDKAKERVKEKTGATKKRAGRGREKEKGCKGRGSTGSSRSGSSSSSGSISSSGSSSSSASSRSGSSSSRSLRSSSSSGSPNPSRRRHNDRQRSRSKSKSSVKKDDKERRRRSPSPRPTKVYLGPLTRNVIKEHIQEIFGTYGKIKMIDIPVYRLLPHLSKGYAYVEFETADEAEKALKHMDGGQIDGQEITATAMLAPRVIRPPPRRLSPPRRMPPPPPYVATHPTPHEKIAVTTETLSGSPQNSLALPRSQTPPLTIQLELLQVELPGTPDLTAPLFPHFPFLHWKSLAVSKVLPSFLSLCPSLYDH